MKLNQIVGPILAIGWLLQGPGAMAQTDDLQQWFDYEGARPFRGDRLEFSALDSQTLTQNGHGIRNELKRKDRDRRSMYETSESLSGTIAYQLSPGAKTIVIQYHEGDTETLFKLYVADVQDKHLINGIANDGVFDVYARIKDVEGKEKVYPFLSIPGRGEFDFTLTANHGTISITIAGKTVSQKTQDSQGVFLKFGDYLQAQDPVTDQQATHAQIPDFYKKQGITVDHITFTNVKYVRTEG